MASLEEIRQDREAKLKLLIEAGLDPYPIHTGRDKTIKQIIDKWSSVAKAGRPLTIAGRVMAKRGQGGLMFVDIFDGTGSLQVLIKKDTLSAESFALFLDTVDIGDIIEVKGRPVLTKRKEKSLTASKWLMLAKSLRSLPDKWHGLKDLEERTRRRYLDSLMSAEVRARFVLRAKIVSAIRQFLDKEDFLEVETPMLQPVAGGATARPFITHHNALDIDLFLRVSPELYLKEMLIGGFPKVYEISRNFRNEGIDQTHNPEFTMLEFYEAYTDAAGQRKFVEKLLKTVVKKTTGSSKITYGRQTIDLAPAFKTISYFDLLGRYALIQDPAGMALKDLHLKADQLGVKTNKNDSREKLLDAIYKKSCRPKLIQPTFIVNYPKDYLPLAKKMSPASDLVDAFQLVVGGIELVKAFSELNDPLDQRERFREQEKMRQSGDDEAQMNDEAFLEAMEYGLPPAGGVGIGIDRLTMLLSDTANIREVIFFPTLRPRAD
ncbi:MAG: lysine--tRNA ligase [Candidatus Paceibacterota bacterium]